MVSSLCVVSLWRNNTSACTFQVALATGISKTNNKTIEKTNTNKKTKISESMGNQSHRENQQHKMKSRFQHQWVANIIEQITKIIKKTRCQDQCIAKATEKTKRTQNQQDFRTNGREPESWILKSCIVCFVLVFSMVLATHWS